MIYCAQTAYPARILEQDFQAREIRFSPRTFETHFLTADKVEAFLLRGCSQ